MVDAKTDALLSGPLYFDNMLAALSYNGTFFFAESDRLLYLKPNTTTTLVNGDNLVAPLLHELIHTNGSQTTPLRGLTIQYVSFRDTRKTFMQPHGVPSGGGL